MYEQNESKKIIKIIAIVIASLFVLITFFWMFETVDAGTVKVVTRFGATTGRVLESGVHVIAPWVDSTTKYNTRKVVYETTTEEKQKGSEADYKDYPVDTNTKDGQQVDMFYTIRFSVDPTKANEIANKIGSESNLVEKIVKTESRIWVRNTPREYTAEELYSGNVVEVQTAIEDKLRPVFAENGLILDSVGIREIKFSDQYVQAIEAKQIEAVRVDTAKNIALRAEEEKKTAITQAEAQAKAQELQRQTISPELLEKIWIEKWDGHLPTYMTGDAQNLIQLPKN